MPRHDDNPRMQAALGYARAGWPVFPVQPGQKVPATEHGFKDATTEPGQIREWWSSAPGRNVGVATGTPGPDVVDVDNKGPKDNGFGNYSRLKAAGLVDHPMALIRTPSGGFHSYFRGTEQGNGSLHGKHVDFRSKGGYVVVPPSSVNGKPYQVVKTDKSDATVDWQAIRNLLDPQPQRQASRTPARPSADPSTTLDRVANWAERAQAGDRNFPLFYAAKQAALAGADPAEIRDRLMRAAEVNGLEGGPREARATIESGIRDAGAGTANRPFVPARQAQPVARPAGAQASTQPAQAPRPAPAPEKGTHMTNTPLTGRALDAELDRLAAEYPEPAVSPDVTGARGVAARDAELKADVDPEPSLGV